MRPNRWALAFGYAAGLDARAVRGADRAPDVANYVIDARFDPSRRSVDGTLTARWTNTSRTPATDLWWQLYLNAFASERTEYMRTGGRDAFGDVAREGGKLVVREMRVATGEDLLRGASVGDLARGDATQLQTPLPRVVAPGETLEVHVAFTTYLPAPLDRTGVWDGFVFAAHWYPRLDVRMPEGAWIHPLANAHAEYFADFGRYDVTLHVPSGAIVGATGTAAPGTLHFAAEGVHDFAWTTWREFNERARVIDGVRLRVLYPPGSDGVAERQIAALALAMPFYRERYGTYPYPQLTVVIPPRAASGTEGVEYPTLITAGGEWFEPSCEHRVEYEVVHEFAHQYFYGVIANDETRWPFLDEAIAEYTTGRALEAHFGADREMIDCLGVRIGYWAYEGGLAADAQGPAIASPAAAFADGRLYGDIVYRRGSTALRTIERAFGRARFDRALAAYARRERFEHPDPDALVAAFDSTGDDGAGTALRELLFREARVGESVERVPGHPAPAPRDEGGDGWGTLIARASFWVETLLRAVGP